MGVIHLKLIGVALFWGGTFVAGRIVSAQLPPLSAALLRFCLASALLVPLALSEGRRTGGSVGVRETGWFLLLGITGVAAYNAFFFAGLQTVPAGRAALIIAGNPAFILVLSALLFREELGTPQYAGVALAVGGAAAVISDGDPLALLAGQVSRGDFYIVGCVLSWVAYSLIGKVALRTMTPLRAVTGSCVAGTLLLLPLALREGIASAVGKVNAEGWAALAFLAAFGTVLGFKWYYDGIHAIGAARAGAYICFVPVSGVGLGVMLLGEPLTPILLGGTAAVTAGVWLASRRRPAVLPPE